MNILKGESQKLDNQKTENPNRFLHWEMTSTLKYTETVHSITDPIQNTAKN